MKDWAKEAERAKKKRESQAKRSLSLLKKMKWDTLDSAQEEINKLNSQWHSHDNFYRIYHRSFKMFRIAEQTLSMWDTLFSLFQLPAMPSMTEWLEDNQRVITSKPEDSQEERNAALEDKNRLDYHNERVSLTVKNLKKLGADDLLITQVKMLKNKIFTLSANGDMKKWAQDGAVMTGVFTLSKKIVENSIRMLLEWKHHEGYLWVVSNIIEINDALVMDSLDILNLRYPEDKDLPNKIKKLIPQNSN